MLKYAVHQQIAVITCAGTLWNKEFNLVSWNEQEPRYDIRWWSIDRKLPGKGITLTYTELVLLNKAIQEHLAKI